MSIAFCKSVRIKPVYFPDSKPLFILLVNNDNQKFIETDLEILTDIFVTFYSRLNKVRFDYE